jgi:hypothetical protein
VLEVCKPKWTNLRRLSGELRLAQDIFAGFHHDNNGEGTVSNETRRFAVVSALVAAVIALRFLRATRSYRLYDWLSKRYRTEGWLRTRYFRGLKMSPQALIDVGSTTFHLLVGEVENRMVLPLAR